MSEYLFNSPAIVAPAENLAALAAEINADHEAGEELTRRGLEHYRAAGEKLLLAKERCGHGKWLKWAKANLRFGERKAQRYMELAKCDVTSDLTEEWRRISGNALRDEGDGQPQAPERTPAADAGTICGGGVSATAATANDVGHGGAAPAASAPGRPNSGGATMLAAASDVAGTSAAAPEEPPPSGEANPAQPDGQPSVGAETNDSSSEPSSDKPHVAQNAGEQEWYTPPDYLGAARQVLGAFDLDPATSAVAQRAVGAATFYTKDDDGLSKPWSGRVWMNPPYAAGLVGKFAEKLVSHHEAGEVTAAVVLVNNATETRWFRALADIASAVCFPTGRVRFRDPDGNPGAPLQGQAVLYLGSDVAAFCAAFADFGFCAEVRREGGRLGRCVVCEVVPAA
jgi:ParB family chromosome partitioning protein